MPSAVSAGRRPLELLLRLAGLGLLAWAWSLSIGAAGRPGTGVAASADLERQLDRWSSVATPDRVEVRFSHAPGPVQRDWLAALRRAGTFVAWSAESLPASALAVLPLADPAGGAELAFAAPSGSPVSLRDTLGVRENVTAGAIPFRLQVSSLEPGTMAVTGGARAREEPRDSLLFRRVLVLGRAGWETRFVAAALLERGWVVDARFVVAPGSDVHQGIAQPKPVTPPAPVEASAGPVPQGMSRLMGRPELNQPRVIPSAQPGPAAPVVRIPVDTARYSAVLVLDSTAAREAGAIGRYLRDGGGVILWPDALSHPAFRALAAGGVGTVLESSDDPIDNARPRESLALAPVNPLHPDAVALEGRGKDVAVAARRLGAGRVVQVGYRDLWRWPMGGDSLAPAAYRAWIAGLVARVALVGRRPLPLSHADPAPLAGVIDRLGPATPPSTATAQSRSALPWWLLALLAVLFLLEWASRRTRGAR